MSHGHHHHHDEASSRLGLAFGLNVAFTLIEFVGAWATNSTAIAADAVHDLGDSLSLAFAWGMQGVSNSGPTPTYSYGLQRLSLLGALLNVLVLLGGSVFVLIQSVPRLWDPPAANAGGMLALAVLGVAVNGAAVWRVRSGTTLNERVVTWHLLEDVLGWVAVLIVSLVMLVADLPWLDPVLSIAITLWVGWNALRNLRATVALFLQAVPADVDLDELQRLATAVDGTLALEHVHVWSLEGDHHVLTGRLVVDTPLLDEAIRIQEAVQAALTGHGVQHVTLELGRTEAGPGPHCS